MIILSTGKILKDCKMPTKQTLNRYGLTEEEWYELYFKYGGACHICKKVPNGRLCVDHEHIRGWKKMPSSERKRYVRGLLCYVCNSRILTRGVTIEKLENAVAYLKEWEKMKK